MRKTEAPRPPSSRSSEGVLRDAAGGGTREYMRLGCSAHGLERVEARFVGQAFSPHRHDSYAIGLTVLGEMALAEVGAAIADFLLETSGSRSPRTALPIAALERARALLYAEPATPHSAAELERATGLDRWTLARQFRAAFGTSPTRYR